MGKASAFSTTAPVAVLMFNRPDVTRVTLERVFQASPSRVFLIADGPRADHPDDAGLCAKTRDIARSMPWDCPVTEIFSDTNLGLRARVTSGLDTVFSQVDQAIVVEDDCLADPSFFPYATELLERYSTTPNVGVVSGNNFLRGRYLSDDSYFFSNDIRIWGWATWARVWKDFSAEGLNHPWTLEEAREAVSALGSKGRQRALLGDAERAHRINSWALPFVLHCLRRGLLSVVPRDNLVTNVGFGAGSTHTKFESFTAEVEASSLAFPLRHPTAIEPRRGAGVIEARVARWQWVSYPLRHPWGFLGRVIRYLRAR